MEDFLKYIKKRKLATLKYEDIEEDIKEVLSSKKTKQIRIYGMLKYLFGAGWVILAIAIATMIFSYTIGSIRLSNNTVYRESLNEIGEYEITNDKIVISIIYNGSEKNFKYYLNDSSDIQIHMDYSDDEVILTIFPKVGRSFDDINNERIRLETCDSIDDLNTHYLYLVVEKEANEHYIKLYDVY